MLSPAQHAARRTGIGSSDIAALVGLSAYRTRMDVFNEKVFGTARAAPEMTFGNDLEAAIVRYRARELGAEVCDDETFTRIFGSRVLAGRTLRDAATPIAITTPDALLFLPDEDVTPLLLEAKAVGLHEAHEWGDDDDDVPQGYRMQAIWHQGVTGIHNAELTAMIAGRPPVPWLVRWRPEVYEQLVEVAERFWTDCVLARVKPDPIDGGEASAEYLRQTYPQEVSAMRAATEAEEQQAALYLAAHEQEKQGKAAKAYAGNLLRESLGGAEGCLLASGGRVTWKKQADGTRVLRVTEPKAKGK